MKKQLIFLAVAGIAFCASGAATVAENGRSAYSIVLMENASPCERYAASELCNYIAKTTGARLKIISGINGVPGQSIYVGRTFFAAKHGCDAGKFGPEEYEIRNLNGDIVIAGGYPRGTLFGVYDFLERFAGVRWLSADFEVTPRLAALTLPDGFRKHFVPTIASRNIYIGNTVFTKRFLEFNRRVRSNTLANDPQNGFVDDLGGPRKVHSLYLYTKDLPREISWMNKSGMREVCASPDSGAVCYSQPDAVKHVIRVLRENIRKDRAACDKTGKPYPMLYNVDNNDCDAACYCPECRNFIEKHGVSGIVIDFANKISEAIQDEFPGVRIMVFAYLDALDAPKGIRPGKHVLVRLAYMDREYKGIRNVVMPLSHPSNEKYVRALDDWNKVADSFAIWDYWKLFHDPYSTPVVNVRAIPGLVRKYASMNTKHMFVEMEIDPMTPLAFFDLRFYLGYRMMFDASIDPEKTVDEFMNGYYGPASSPMKEYLALIESGMEEMKNAFADVKVTDRPYLNAGFFRKSYALMDAAEKAAAGNPAYLEHIRLERLILDITYTRLRKQLGDPMKFTDMTLKNRLEQGADIFLRKYFTEEAIKVSGKQARNSFLGAVGIAAADPLHRIIGAPIKTFDPGSKHALELTGNALSGGSNINDPDAFGGIARTITHEKNRQDKSFHRRDFDCGVYDFSYRIQLARMSLSRKTIPEDEKYHWYYVGRSRLLTNTKLWTHWSWTFHFNLSTFYNADKFDQLYDIYLSLKLQGPVYVDGSTRQNDIRVDRIALIPVEKDDPVYGLGQGQ